MAAEHAPRFDELFPAYALGALDDDERREMEAHLVTGCPICRQQLALFQGDLEDLAGLAPPVAPSAATRARILAAAGRPPAAAAGPARWWALAAAALLAVAVWGGVQTASLREQVQQLTAERARSAQRADVLEREVRQTRQESERLAQALAIIAVPGVQSVALAGLPAEPAAKGHTFVNAKDGKALFYAFDLQPLPPDKTYQLWFIAGGRPVSAGVFSVDRRGNGSLQVDRVAPVAQIQAWAVTIEPAGGVPQPTGAMVLKG